MKETTNGTSCPRRQEQIIVQKGSKEVLLFNMDDGSYYALNEVGSRIWELCDGTHGVEQMVCTVAKEYGAPTEMVEMDVLELLDELRSKNLVVECSGERKEFNASGAGQGSP